jgi:hypothetical protein
MMEERGVSKIVSVKFHKAEEQVPDHAPSPLVPLPSVRTVEDEEDTPHSREETLEIMMAK